MLPWPQLALYIYSSNQVHTYKDTNAAKPDRIKSKGKHAEKMTFGTGVNLSILEKQEAKAKDNVGNGYTFQFDSTQLIN